jgi:hypothetical protein
MAVLGVYHVQVGRSMLEEHHRPMCTDCWMRPSREKTDYDGAVLHRTVARARCDRVPVVEKQAQYCSRAVAVTQICRVLVVDGIPAEAMDSMAVTTLVADALRFVHMDGTCGGGYDAARVPKRRMSVVQAVDYLAVPPERL